MPSPNGDTIKRFRGLEFWIWNKQEHIQKYGATGGKCCFNHVLGLPRKGNETKPLFDYEKEIYEAFEQTKYIWIKKARGLGVTEFTLRYIVWKCLASNEWKEKNVCIVTGPRIDLAVTLVERIKRLFPTTKFDTKETVIELNGCHIQAYPSHNLDAMRGLTDVVFILLDEADYFSVGQQQDARAVSEGYIAKTDPHIVMVSTPNRPEGLFETIEKEENCMYHRMFLPYTRGLGKDKIYTEEEIAKAKESPSFEREYNLQYIGEEGNIFSHESLEKATALGTELHENRDYRIDEIRQDTYKSMGVDAGFGSSKFGIVITQYVPGNRHKNWNEYLQVLYAEEFERPDFNDMANLVLRLKQNYVVEKIYIDSSNPEVIRAIKGLLNERTDYERRISILKQRHPRYLDLAKFMNVIPVSFREEGREMLGFTKQCIDSEFIAIHPNFHKLLVSLRTAQATDGLLSKDSTSHNDIFDALRLSLWAFKEKE